LNRRAFSDIDLIEVKRLLPLNTGVEKELGRIAPRELNGGAIAGHPLGATGTVSLTPCHELHRRGGKYGLATACVGGGKESR
jgi:acetyl-CoA acetyltransferase